MNDEIKKVLRMIEEGKIGAEEGAVLLRLIKAEDNTDTAKISNYSKKQVRIIVTANGISKVNITVPIKLIQVLINIGKGITASIPDAEKYLKDVDLDVITEAIEQQIEGNIVDLETEDGERVLISVE